ncbi:D-arabinose 1-dehydrogenase [Neolecta irregularis DAH-3]|uniref:D-arabinose 1-dehydrogenase n=1 Tax=Neolecta irregularis (strain DAH-3) TaxID=1198029 RepID=A0A1U7LX11_NEOID|nr:D-arabinose 1-dehydrogenase [Neolecta irregularis DAH-3]|eukprot:OLL27169.1 D-arabinose 1-dehydrogenase [Neolecta irregularis DAH-3]
MSLKSVSSVQHPVLTNLADGSLPIVLGTGTFSLQYSTTPNAIPVQDILTRAFELGVRAIDTSPYYGDSEILLGKALRSLVNSWPRDRYYLATKCGRISQDKFDYSKDWIEKSVYRSLMRLNTEYLDAVMCHDVEFVSDEQVLDALCVLFKLKEKGVIRNVGITGLPLERLLHLANLARDTFNKPLDLILTYTKFTLQNTTLKKFLPKIHGAGVKVVLNAGALSMGMLRPQGPPLWHPASAELRNAAQKACEWAQNHDNDIASLALRFVFTHWTESANVTGIGSVNELEVCVQEYWRAQKKDSEELFEGIQKVFGQHMHETWPSPLHGFITKDPETKVSTHRVG